MNTKPWEEEWELDPRTHDPLIAVRRKEKPAGDQDREVARAMSEEEALFVAAAPDMARALLNLLGESRHLNICHALRDASRTCHRDCQLVQAALAKAGVPLP